MNRFTGTLERVASPSSLRARGVSSVTLSSSLSDMSTGVPGDKATDRLITEETDEMHGSGSKTKGVVFKAQAPTSIFCRSTTILFAVLLLGGLAILYLGNTNEQNGGGGIKLGLDKDRAGAYNVKILPSSLSDAELDKLPIDAFSYLAMIDAGSSGCRAHIYRYGKLGSLDGPLYVLPQHVSKKVKPGLSSFAKTPEGAGPSLKELVEFVKSKVPESDWAVTPIWLKATAGLRMLEASESGAVLVSVRNFLADKANSPFIFRSNWAGIISGNEEGGFGWIAFNYLKKIIGPKKKTGADAQLPYAVIEMGGASAQVSQIAPTENDAKLIPDDYRFSFTIEGEAFTLYTHSYLGFGAEQAREGLNKLLLKNTTVGSAASATRHHQRRLSSNNSSPVLLDTCLNEGYARPSSQQPKEAYEGPKGKYTVTGASKPFGTCSASLSSLFSQHSKSKSCKKGAGPYSFSCVYQPAFVTESPNFLVFENFFYMSSALGVHPFGGSADSKTSFPLLTTPTEFQAAADRVCSLPWGQVQEKFPIDSQGKDVNQKLCFVSSYASVFLTKGLGVRPDKVVTVQKDVDGSEIEWALGAAYKEAADFLKRTNLRPQR